MRENINMNTGEIRTFKKGRSKLLTSIAAYLAVSYLISVQAAQNGVYVRRAEPLAGTTPNNFSFGITLSDDISGTGVTSVVGLAFGSDSAQNTNKASPLNRQFEYVDRSFVQVKFSPRDSGEKKAMLEVRNALDGKVFNIPLVLIPEPPQPPVDNSTDPN